MGHLSVAMRSLAQVEHPHFIQRPVPPNPLEFQNSQPWQVSILVFNVSSSVFESPLLVHLTAEFAKLIAIEVILSGACGILG